MANLTNKEKLQMLQDVKSVINTKIQSWKRLDRKRRAEAKDDVPSL